MREPPTAERIAEMRRYHQACLNDATRNCRVAELLSALDYCQERFEHIEALFEPPAQPGEVYVVLQDVLNRLFREKRS